jgi:large subunit ribosomal protein L1
MKKISKRIKLAQGKVEEGKFYSVPEALIAIKELPKAKFDESVEIAVHLNMDPKKTETVVRGTVVLPSGTGRKRRIIVFCKGEAEAQAKEAGADYVGANDLIEKVLKGFMDFDCVVATPDMMKDVSKLGKVLGPRGLMPSPKTGTVTNNVSGAIKELKAGKVEFKVDKQSGMHLSIGKSSFSQDALEKNINAFLEALNQVRPASIKGQFIKSLYLSTTMGPGFKLKV